MNCNYVETEGKFKCTMCGDEREYFVYRRCDKTPSEDLVKPQIVDRIRNYAVAVKRWQDHGRPVRSDEQVAGILDLCTKCEYYDGEICLHHKCGCKVNDSKWAIVNKIRMATESCPIGKWKAIVEVESQ